MMLAASHKTAQLAVVALKEGVSCQCCELHCIITKIASNQRRHLIIILIGLAAGREV